MPYWMGVPMIAGEHTLGAVVLRGEERPFTEDEERLLTNIADLAALALRSAQLFAERTKAYADLAAAHEQLVRSAKLRALGEMASGVAHDFNNVLAAIVGRAQLLLRHIDDPSYAAGSRSSSARPSTAPRPCGGSRSSPGSGATSRSDRWT